MRNIFDQYSQPDNRLTHALISSLNEDKKLLSSFLKKFCKNYFTNVSSLKIDQQTLPGLKSLQLSDDKKKGLPDGVIYNDEKCLIIECKINLELTEDQLIRHERTVKRKGFDQTFGLTITKDSISNINLKNWIHITWKEIYNWAYVEKSKSNWSNKLLDYLNVAENKMVEDEYLTEGSITEFNGIHFDNENEYSHLEAKRLLKLLMNKIKKNKTLARELNINLSGKSRGGIKKEIVLWDYLTFNYNSKVLSFTDEPHLTVAMGQRYVEGHLTIPYRIKGKTKKNFYKMTWKEFNEIIYKIALNFKNFFGNSEGFVPHLYTSQRRYPSQSSPSIQDAVLDIDIRTAFADLSSELKPTQKQQTEWLKAVFEINQNKKSNIQFGIGGKFYFNKHTIVNNKDADQVLINTFLACKPLTKYLFEGTK